MKLYYVFMLLISSMTFAQNGSIKGRITSNREAVPAVTVSIPQLKIMIAADENGNYEIKDIPFGNHQLVFNFIGFKSEKRKVKIDSATPVTLNIQMQEDNMALEDVVITDERSKPKRKPRSCRDYNPKTF